MAQSCKTCQLDKKTVKQLEQDFVDGMNKHRLSKKYDVSYDSIEHHLDNHLPVKMAKAAELESVQDGFNLMQKIDELYKWMNIIFQRNFDKKKDGMALKALAQQRHTLELLAKISYALHQNKVLEMEQEKMKHLDINLPLELLTQAEQSLLLQLNMKLLGQNVTIDLSEYSAREKAEEKVEHTTKKLVSSDEVDSFDSDPTIQKQNTTKKLVSSEQQDKPKRMKRVRSQPDKDAAEQEESKKHTGDLRFKSLTNPTPQKTSTHGRRAFSEIMKKNNPPQYGSDLQPSVIPIPGYALGSEPREHKDE